MILPSFAAIVLMSIDVPRLFRILRKGSIALCFLFQSVDLFHPNVFFSQQHGVTPIIWAAGRGHADVVRALLRQGAKVNSADKVKKHQQLKIELHVNIILI